MAKTTKQAPRRAAAATRASRSAVNSTRVAASRSRRWDVSARDWARYHRCKNEETRRALLEKYLPLVRNVATRMAMGFPRSVELSDLINSGVVGLVEAFEHFDPSRGVKFETYAVPRIRGSILDELRALDWVPRSTRARSREIERATLELENKHGRRPEKHELARYLQISERELHMAMDDVASATMLSLDEVVFPDDDNRQVPRIETISDSSQQGILAEIERGELRSFLVVAMDRLTKQEKLVIALYYFEELTLKEIGAVMKISESRVSQIHTRAIMKLRNMVRERFALTG